MDAGPNFKYTNIFNALIASYALANMEGWPDTMNSYVYIFNNLLESI